MSWLLCILSNVVLASLLALVAWFVQRRLHRPALARLLWVLVLVKLVTPPLVSVPLHQPPGIMACALGGCRCGRHAQLQIIVRDRLPWVLLAAWSAGAAAAGWIAWRRWARFRRLLAHSRPASAEWQSLTIRLASELSLRRPPEVLTMPGRLPPLVVPGLRQPRVLLPADLLDRLTPSQREALLLHELAHLRCGDHLIRLLELSVAVVYWWLPATRAIGRALRACEESCCDAAVVAHRPQARRDYARLLLDVIDFADPLSRPAVPHATALSAPSDLEQRLRAILAGAQAAPRTRPAVAITMGLCCVVLPCGLQYAPGAPSVRAASSPPAAASDVCAPAAETAPPPGIPAADPAFAAFCCPS